MWERFEEVLQRTEAVAGEAEREYAARMDKAFSAVLASASSRPDAISWGNIVADLRLAASDARGALRRRIVRDVNASDDLPRLPADLPDRMTPCGMARLPPLHEELQVTRVAIATAGASLLSYVIAKLLLRTEEAVIFSFVGAFLGICLVGPPISPLQKRLLAGAGLAVLAGTVAVTLTGGVWGVFLALRAGGLRWFRAFASAGLIVLVRRWTRRTVVTRASYTEGKHAALAEFRADLDGDARMIALTVAMLAEQAKCTLADSGRLREIEAAIGAALRHADSASGADVLRRLANVLDLRLAAEPDDGMLNWSIAMQDFYVPKGLVREGERVLVLRPPRLRRKEDGRDEVIERGEVVSAGGTQ